MFPSWLEQVFESLTKIVPSKLMLPVKFGDIKLYVARRSSVTVSSEKPPDHAIVGSAFFQNESLANNRYGRPDRQRW
jgi:hypothetical protein